MHYLYDLLLLVGICRGGIYYAMPPTIFNTIYSINRKRIVVHKILHHQSREIHNLKHYVKSLAIYKNCWSRWLDNLELCQKFDLLNLNYLMVDHCNYFHDLSILVSVQYKRIKVKLLEHQMDENNLFTNTNTYMKNPKYYEVNYSQYRYEY